MVKRRGILGGALTIPFLGPSNVSQSAVEAPYYPAQNAISNTEYISDVEYARRKLKRLQILKDAPPTNTFGLSPSHIECRKATSESIKRLLIEEWHRDRAIKEAEQLLKSALWKEALPDWMRRIVE